jgi:hypothetical protein
MRVTGQGLKMRPVFFLKLPKFGGIMIEFKNHRFFEFKFETFKTNSEKYVKKTRSNSKNIGGDFFFKSKPFYWIKFKLNQKCKNGLT